MFGAILWVVISNGVKKGLLGVIDIVDVSEIRGHF
jgi:hypothetical protein